MSVPLAIALLAVATATPMPEAAVAGLVDRFEAARAAFADADLAATLAPDYQEISPVGDVDDRATVIGFYRRDRRRPAPAMRTNERTVALHGGWGIVTERMAFDVLRPDGTTMTRSMRVRYVAAKDGGAWRLVSAQYTGIPAR